ncbi:MAG: hypothetical protein J2O49_05405 [Sciscionella sp.]|nr:hypothetical protein [Sciscionella sp.]
MDRARRRAQRDANRAAGKVADFPDASADDSVTDSSAGSSPGSAPRHEQRDRLVKALSVDLDELFGPGRKHIREYTEWVAVAKMDDREDGSGPLDLDRGVITLPAEQQPTAQQSAEQQPAEKRSDGD